MKLRRLSSITTTEILSKGVLAMAQSTAGRVFNVVDLEREIEAEGRKVHESGPDNFGPPRVRAPAPSIPDYVEHREGATEVGKLSAEAVVHEYEAAAKEIEAM